MQEITHETKSKAKKWLSKVERTDLSKGTRSAPILGLPVARIIPQDIHSVMDYANGAAGMLSAAIANTARGRMVNATLAAAAAGTSAATDYRLSLAKLIPIEVHEVIDYVWGISNILAPFMLGYARKDKAVTAMQVALGASTIAASLITDYRAYDGVGAGYRRAAKKKKRSD
jgi:hypothetical protein